MTKSDYAAEKPVAGGDAISRCASETCRNHTGGPALWQIAAPSGLAFLLFIAVTRGWIGLPDKDPGGVVTMLAGVMLLPWLAPIFRKLKLGALELEVCEQVKRLGEDVREQMTSALAKTQETAIQVQQIDRIMGPIEVPCSRAEPIDVSSDEARPVLRDMFEDLLSKAEQQHLFNLHADAEPVRYQDVHDALRRELDRLLAFGLIGRKPGKGIRSLFQERDDIRNHFELTPRGKTVAEGLNG